MKIKNLVVFGTRPEAIKMAPLVKEFKKRSDYFETKVCIKAQHREMLDQVLSFFDIIPDFDLDLMKPGQDLYSLTSNIITNLKPILEEFEPNYVYVHGDTTTTMASSLSSFYFGSKVCHVEAGLRTFDMSSPFPEEMNRWYDLFGVFKGDKIKIRFISANSKMIALRNINVFFDQREEFNALLEHIKQKSDR